MAYSSGPLVTQHSVIQGSPSELSVKVTILGADNLPHMKRWIRTRRRFYVTVNYQTTTMKLASAKFDGQTATWSKKFDTFFLRPSLPFTLRLFAKRFLSADILVGKTQEILPSAGTASDSYALKGGDRKTAQSMPPVVLHLKVTVKVNATTSPVLPASPTDPNSPNERFIQPSPPQSYPPHRAERETHTKPYPQSEQPYPVNAIPDQNFLASPPHLRPSASSTSMSPAAGEASGSRWPSNPSDPIAPDLRSSPRLPPKPIDHTAVNEEPSSRWTSNSSNRILPPNPRSSAPPDHTPPSTRYGPSSANIRNPIPPKTTPSPSLSPNPITLNSSARSGSSGPAVPPQPTPANMTPTPSVSTNPTDAIASFGTRPQRQGSLIPEFEPDIDDIIQTVQRFRILSVGRSGVGKSSLINHVFGIDAAHVQNHRAGLANIQREFVSPQNQYFVLHDSEGFEPGDLSNYDTVSKFVQERSGQKVPLSERIHGLWLCTETPTAGGRVFETGDEKLLQFSHKHQVPMVIVFTQYDRLVRTKELELREEYPQMDPASLRATSLEDAQEAFNICLKSLQRTMNRLKIPMPRYARVSVRPGHQEDIAELVTVTRDVVLERVKGDAWVLWAIAQRQNLPVKIDACITKGISRNYKRALLGVAPGAGQMLLQHCLKKMHKDIITCWNFKGEVHKSPQFQQLMLCLVQDVYTKSGLPALPALDVINNFVTLATSASTLIAPPVAVLGLTYTFVQWLSTTALDNVAGVQRLLIAYTVDLIRVLRELFDITLRPDLALTTTWTELRAAFEAYEQSQARQRIHHKICRTSQGDRALTADDICNKVRELLRE